MDQVHWATETRNSVYLCMPVLMYTKLDHGDGDVGL